MSAIDYCAFCGREVIFRNIDGRVVPLHPEGGCPNGGVGRKAKVLEKNCPKCGQNAFYVTHNGGFFWVDELGPPWPKHPCFPTQPGFSAVKQKLEKTPRRKAAAVPVFVPAKQVASSAATRSMVTDRPTGRQMPAPLTDVKKLGKEQKAPKTVAPKPSTSRPPKGIGVDGFRGSSIRVSPKELSTLPRMTLHVDYEGRSMSLEYIPVINLLAKVLGPTDESDRHLARESYVVAKGSGVAVFSWAELDPELTEPHVGVVIRSNGAALPAELGPYWLAVFGEKLDVRSIRNLDCLQIRKLER
jgi:hypothetical protein